MGVTPQDADLIILGGGYWGVASALFAEARGKRVFLVDDRAPYGASISSSGYFQRSWYKKEWLGRIDRAAQDAVKHGVKLRQCGAEVYHWSKPEVKLDPRLEMWDPLQFLMLRQPDALGEARHIWDVSPYGTPTIIALGCGTDAFLRSVDLPELGVTPLRGTGVIIDAKGIVLDRPIIQKTSPYAHYTIRQWDEKHWRVGETLEVVPGKHDQYIEKMLDRMSPNMPFKQLHVKRTISGYRPMLKDGPVVKKLNEHTVVATGGGRVGGILSFWAAREAYHQLFGDSIGGF